MKIIFIAATIAAFIIITFIAWTRWTMNGPLIALTLPNMPQEEWGGAWERLLNGYPYGFLYSLKSILIWGMILVFIVSAGRLIFKRFFENKIGIVLSLQEKLSLSFMLGSIFTSFLWFGLASCKLLVPETAVFLCLLSAVFLWFERENYQSIRTLTKKTMEKFSARHVLLAGMIFFLALIAANSFLYQDHPDVLQIDLTLPKFYIQQGKVLFYPHEAYTYQPQNWWMILLWPLLLKSEMAAVLLVWSFYLALLLFAYGFIKRKFNSTIALASALLLMSVPAFSWLSITLKNDLPTALLLFAHHAIFLESLELASLGTASPPLFLLSGILCGGAAGFKQTALIPAAATFLCLMWFSFQKKSPAPFRNFIFPWLAGFLMIAGPWMLRVFFETGNPLYPYFQNVFSNLIAPWHAPININHPLNFMTAKEYLSTASGFIFQRQIFSPSWNPSIVYGAAGIASFFLIHSLAWRLALTGSLLAVISLTAATFELRYLLGSLAFFVLLSFAFGFRKFLDASPRRQGVIFGLLLLVFQQSVFQTGTFWHKTCLSMRALISNLSPGNFMSREESMDNLRWVTHFINTRTPKDDAVLCIATNFNASLERKFYYASVIDKEPAAIWAESSPDAKSLAQSLQEKGIKHILISPEPFTGLMQAPLEKLRIRKREIDLVRELCQGWLKLRMVSPNGKIFWYSFSEGPAPEKMKILREDIEKFPVMAIRQAKIFLIQGQPGPAEKIARLAGESRISGILKATAADTLTLSQKYRVLELGRK